VKLVAADTSQFIAGIGELGHARRQFSARNAHFPFPPSTKVRQPAPSIQRVLHTPRVSCTHMLFFLSDGSPTAGFPSLGPPSTCLKPRNTEIPLSPKTLSRGTARARARAKSRSLDQPYNPRMLTQESVTRTNPGKAEAKLEPGRANTLRNVRGSSPWPLGGLAAIGRMLGRLSMGFLFASPVRVKGAKRMGAIHRLWPVPGMTGSRECVRGRQLRRVTVRCQLRDGCRGLSEIISREIAGNRRGTGGLTGWLVSLWR
jgi:hypothetical protein